MADLYALQDFVLHSHPEQISIDNLASAHTTRASVSGASRGAANE